MEKIFLIWNIHPNESPVTKPLAEKLKPLLEKRGFEIQIVKIPFSQTIPGKYLQGEYSFHPTDEWIKAFRLEHPGAFVIELHSTPDYDMFDQFYTEKPRDLKKIRNWRAAEYVLWLSKGELELHHGDLRHYAIEIPAVYRDAPPGLYALTAHADPRHYKYLRRVADAKESQRKNYLDPLAIRKLAHLIDATLKTAMKKYRQPRFPPHVRRLSKISQKTQKILKRNRRNQPK